MTPAHWPQHRVGLGAGPTVIVGGAQIDATTLTYAAGIDPSTIVAQGQAAGEAIGQQFGAQAQATWNQQTSTAANESRKLQGAADAVDLATNGFNPDSPADDAKLVGVIAGALAFIPVAGPFLSGALMLLYAIGEGIADLLKAAGLIWYGCRTSGNWTTADILNGIASSGGLPPMPAGSFASLAMPALAKNAATISNCKSGYSNLQILAAITQLWNANASGPPVSIYIPAIDTAGDGSVFAVPMQSGAAFQPASNVTDILGDLGASDMGVNGVFFTQAPFILSLNGTSLTALDSAAATGTTVQLTANVGSASTGGKVAIVGGSLAAGAVVGTVVFSYVKGEAVSQVVKGIWRGMKGWFSR